jgi:CubicO group peptidase (beta-lactamase class C family)
MTRTTAAASAVLLLASTAVLLQGLEPATDARIRRIESALLPPVIVNGRPLETTSLADRMRELRVPGVSVAVFRDGRIEWARGWGLADVASGRPVERHTRFQAASISKPVAAAAVLALVSQGRLTLDGPVNAHLTSWKLPGNGFTAAQPVTLRRLLTHSAGTTVHGFRGYADGEPVPSLVQVLDGAVPANSAAVRVDIPVGSRWRYSGGGISIAQLAAEDVLRRPFAEIARDLVLRPFGMDHSTYAQPLPPALRPLAATGYRASGDPVPGRWHTYPEQAAAGLWTTAEDLARFAIEVQRIAAGRSSKVMSRALAQDMLRRQVDDWGLGVGVLGDGAAMRFSHGGANEGFRAFWVGYCDHGSGVVVMTNSDAGAPLAGDIVRTVAREYGFAGLLPLERTLGTADPARYPDFAGSYVVAAGQPPLRIEADGGRLFRRMGPRADQRMELLPEGGDVFFAVASDARIRFVRGAEGAVIEAIVESGGRSLRAARQ